MSCANAPTVGIYLSKHESFFPAKQKRQNQRYTNLDRLLPETSSLSSFRLDIAPFAFSSSTVRFSGPTAGIRPVNITPTEQTNNYNNNSNETNPLVHRLNAEAIIGIETSLVSVGLNTERDHLNLLTTVQFEENFDMNQRLFVPRNLNQRTRLITELSHEEDILLNNVSSEQSDSQALVVEHHYGHRIARALGFQHLDSVFRYQSFSGNGTNDLLLLRNAQNIISGDVRLHSSLFKRIAHYGPAARLLHSSAFQHHITNDLFNVFWGVHDDEFYDCFEGGFANSTLLTTARQGLDGTTHEVSYLGEYDNSDEEVDGFREVPNIGQNLIGLPLPLNSRMSHQERNSPTNVAGAEASLYNTINTAAEAVRLSVRPTTSGANDEFFGNNRVQRGGIYNHIPYRILDAPGLKNDFYSNLVSWSPVTGQVAVGLMCEVYAWAEDAGAKLLRIPSEHGEVACVSFAPSYTAADYQDSIVPESFKFSHHDTVTFEKKTKSQPLPPENLLAVGYKDGTLVLYDLDSDMILGYHSQSSGSVGFICWTPAIEVKNNSPKLDLSIKTEQKKPEKKMNQGCRGNRHFSRSDVNSSEVFLNAGRESPANFPNSSASSSSYVTATSGVFVSETSATTVTDSTSAPTSNPIAPFGRHMSTDSNSQLRRDEMVVDIGYGQYDGEPDRLNDCVLGPKHKQYLLIGDEKGAVTRLCLNWRGADPIDGLYKHGLAETEKSGFLKGHTQQICGNFKKNQNLSNLFHLFKIL